MTQSSKRRSERKSLLHVALDWLLRAPKSQVRVCGHIQTGSAIREQSFNSTIYLVSISQACHLNGRSRRIGPSAMNIKINGSVKWIRAGDKSASLKSIVISSHLDAREFGAFCASSGLSGSSGSSGFSADPEGSATVATSASVQFGARASEQFGSHAREHHQATGRQVSSSGPIRAIAESALAGATARASAHRYNLTSRASKKFSWAQTMKS